MRILYILQHILSPKNTNLLSLIGVPKWSKTHLQQCMIFKLFARGETPGPPLQKPRGGELSRALNRKRWQPYFNARQQ